MYPFCVGSIAVNPHLRAPHGVLRAAMLPISADARCAAQLLAQEAQAKADGALHLAQQQAGLALRNAHSEAGALVQAARDSADDIVGAARAQAEQLLADARERASALTGAEQQRVIVQAAALLQSLQQANDTILERVEDMVAGLAHTLYDRLVLDTTARERIDAGLRRVLLEAPPKLVDALLRVHPDDAALLPDVDWPVKTDAALAPGMCRLEAANGQWCANFDVAAQVVKSAFTQGIEDTRRAALAARKAGDSDGAQPRPAGS